MWGCLWKDVSSALKDACCVDPEIQQRSVEYSIMAQYDDQELITQVWEHEHEHSNMHKIKNV